jgi:4-hydroxybenzoyl-CoA thioesterase
VSFTVATPVRFSDIDHAGIVYFPRFFHMFHLAFEELWRVRLAPGGYAELMNRDRIGFPAVHASCDFAAPLRFGDTAEVDLAVAQLGARSITWHYKVYRAEGNDRTLCAEGRVVSASVDLTRFVAVAVPDRIVAVLQDLVEPPT